MTPNQALGLPPGTGAGGEVKTPGAQQYMGERRAEESQLQQEQPGPVGHPWVEANRLAKRGLTPEGEPITQQMRDLASEAVAHGSSFIQLPAAATPLAPILYPAIGAAGEAGRQLIKSGELTDPSALAYAAALPRFLRQAGAGTVRGAAGAALTGMGAETGRELLAGEEISPMKVGTAGAAGPAATVVGAASRNLPQLAGRLPGGAAAMNQEAVETARGIAANPRLRPKVPSDTLYSQVEQINPRINTPNMISVAHRLLRRELEVGEGPLQGELLGIARQVIEKAQQHQGQVPFRELRALEERIRARTGIMGGQAPTEVPGGYRALADAIAQDYDAAAAKQVPVSQYFSSATKGITLLRQARAAYRREKAIPELAEVIESGVGKGRSDLEFSFNPAKPLNALDEARIAPTQALKESDVGRKYQFLRESFTDTELEDMQRTLLKYRGLRSMPPVGGEAAIGSGRVLGRVLGGQEVGRAVGRGLGGLVGQGEIGASVGGVAGIALTQFAHTAVSNALATPGGRRALRTILDANGGFLDERSIRVLAQFTRSQTMGDRDETP
jgi:hypothetical protein